MWEHKHLNTTKNKGWKLRGVLTLPETGVTLEIAKPGLETI